MPSVYNNHNFYKESPELFYSADPHLKALAQLKYQYSPDWWANLSMDNPGIYILTGGRQVGKSTSCKLLIKYCLKNKLFNPEDILYLPCDEIFDAKELSRVLRFFLESVGQQKFLLIIDEITYVKNWHRVIKALADEGYFTQGLCILTGSDTLILKEAAMSFPGRRGIASTVDFHLYPLTFFEYVKLLDPKSEINNEKLFSYFKDYLITGGYLRAINDYAQHGKVLPATHMTYEQWIRGDFLKMGKNENYLLSILQALLTIGVSQISYSGITQKVGVMSKETCIDYMNLLERMDIIFDLQAFDQNRKQGFPRKKRKFYFYDPFIQRTIYYWLQREGYLNSLDLEPSLVEGCVASHCYRQGKTYYLKGQGEIDVVWQKDKNYQFIEVKWCEQLRPNDLKMLKQFKNNSLILSKLPQLGMIDTIQVMPIYLFLYQLAN